LQEAVQATNHTIVIQPAEDYEASQPVFRAQLYDEDANNADIEGSSDDDDTKKSFDFTGELKKLNESGASDRRSFVEQLRNAFKSPARIDLKYDFLSTDPSRQFLSPPVPSLHPGIGPHALVEPLGNAEDTVNSVSQTSPDSPVSYNEGYCCRLDLSRNSMTDIGDESTPALKPVTSKCSRPSDGQLNVSFKFGGGQSSVLPPSVDDECRLRTMPPIMPSMSHRSFKSFASSCVDEDNSILKSIYAQASNVLPCASDVAIPRPRQRVDSDSSSKRYARQISVVSRHADISHGPTLEDSRFSFAGLDSFDEVRRGFEFGPNRPAFYPPPGAEVCRNHNKHDSIFSVASISSYGSVIDPGDIDPFGYANSSRPPSEDMSISISLSVDDTFSFIHRGRRTRVDSDASSFYFKSQPAMLGPIRRGYRARDSMISVSSNAPPVSLYNRNHGAHRRNDSGTSASSVAYSYAMHGASGGKVAWAKHTRNDPSLDSIMSDYSAGRLGRPGLGDKMLDSVFDHGMPLSAISASPTHNTDNQLNNTSSYDSLVDTRRSPDSLFDNTGDKTSTSSDSAFFNNMAPVQSNHMQGRHFRPISVISAISDQSPRKEDDTMISVRLLSCALFAVSQS
jgi:serine/arginine repetitive matrix protein 2